MNAHEPLADTPGMSDLDTDFIGGAVSLARLIKIYGVEHLETVDALWSAEGTDFIVLFANDDETEFALLPVGAAHAHKSLSTALRLNAGGMHAVCHAMARDGVRPVPFTLPADWRLIARKHPAEAETIESLITEAGTPENALLAVLKHLTTAARDMASRRLRITEREEELLTKETHVTASAARIEELMKRYGKWEELKEQTALLEQREKYVREVEERLIKRAQEMELLQEEMNQAVANLAAQTCRIERNGIR